MKTLVCLAAGFATAVCATVAAQCALGFGTPNVVDGESIIVWWATLWTLSFVSVPLGIWSAISVGYAAKAAYDFVTG